LTRPHSKADVHEGEHQVGGLAREHEIAGERQRAADPDRRPVDRRQHRLGHAADTGDDRVVALAQRLAHVRVAVGRGLEAGLEVGPGRERPTVPGDRHRPHGLVARGQLDGRPQVVPELGVPRVHPLGAVQPDAQLGPVRRAAAQRDRLQLGQRGGHRGHPTGRAATTSSSPGYGDRVRRPRIGICTALETARWSVWENEAMLLSRSYVDAVQRAGGLVLMLPPDPRAAEEPDAPLEPLDGLVLAGGADIDPAAYGAPRHPRTVGTTPERDAAEIPLARRAVERDLPLLGICRGMQLLNVALGGTLIQHLPDDVGHGDHRRHLGSFDNADHDVRLEPGSLAAEACGELLHTTKSHHHQGVDRLGEGVVASGWSVLDELVEAIEVPAARFALGVQWHPEVDRGSGVIAAFVAECAPRRPARVAA
jgi:putative glutamine amidotransferase